VLSALVVIVLSGPALTLQDTDLVCPQDMIDRINSKQNSWKASSDWVGDMSIGVARTRYAATEIRPREFPEHNWGALLDYMAIPQSFNASVQWPQCAIPIQNQAQCGSCWAFGATEALAVRICIGYKQQSATVLSPQYLVSCDTTSYGCNGGYPDLAWTFMQKQGVPTAQCVSYTSGTGNNGICPSTCDNGMNLQFFKATSVLTYSSPASIQAAILANGPIEVAFTVYQDFMSYTSGVYVHTEGGVLGGHAVMMIGWGNDGKQNYWICANSWTNNWGMYGNFNIAFGQCGIDSQGVAGLVQ